MELVLRRLPWTTCLVNLDDVLIHGKTFLDNMHSLREVLSRLRGASLKLSPKKCSLFRRQAKYLGHVVSASGVVTDPEKTAAVDHWPIPTDSKEVRRFVGLCTYYRRFVPGFAAIAKPLHQLTEKGRHFEWTDECDAAFKQLKKALTEGGGVFVVDTDASDVGIGCILSQIENGEERVIANYSRTLRKPERNYCVTRKELLAVVAAIGQIHHYLYGRRFRVRSDHASLQWLMRFKNPEEQTARWLQRMQEYDFEVVYRAGKNHVNADALSRIPRPYVSTGCRHCLRDEEREDEAYPAVCSIRAYAENTETSREQQLADTTIASILHWKEQG